MSNQTIIRLGKHQKHALSFLCGIEGWIEYKSDRATKEAIKRLESRGLVETQEEQLHTYKFCSVRITKEGKRRGKR